jgi:Domain of unknown function (DUF4249)
MKLHFNIVIYLYCLIMLFTSCDKIITLPFTDNDSRVIIEANITDQSGPYIVKLSRSINIDQSNIYPVVDNGTVIISDNTGVKDTLKYSSVGIYKTKLIRGVYGRTYSLEVTVDGKKYTAQSTMPDKVNLDSLRINTFPINGKNQYSIIPVFTDPLELGNSYRFIQQINDTLDNNYNIFNDNLNNGKINQRPLGPPKKDISIKNFDIITVEMQCITTSAQLYYFTLSQQSGAGPGGGTAPTNPPNNIVGGALGLFSAHTSQTKTIRIPN